MHYRKFSSTNDIDSWTIQYQHCFPSNTDDDITFLKALDYYTGSANTFINNHLRYNVPIESDEFNSLLEKMIEKLPTYHIPDNLVAYRYVSKELLKSMCSSYPPKKGTILHDKGFMSTTLFKESISSYRNGRSQNILLIISIPSGTKGTYVGLLDSTLNEYEIILAQNTKLRIDFKLPFITHCFWCTVVDI